MITMLRTTNIVCALGLLSIFAAAAEPKGLCLSTKAEATGNGCGQFADKAPEFELKDAVGTLHNGSELYKGNGMLLMLTAPNLTQFEKQKRWNKVLRKEAWPLQNPPRCVVIEDLSQQQYYKEKVRSMMADKSREEKDLTVLVDENGDVRRDFGVNNDETVILVVDGEGHVIHHEADDVEPDSTAAQRILTQVRKLAAALRAANPRDEDPPALAARKTSSDVAVVRE